MNFPSDLQDGDVLLYDTPADIIDRLIEIHEGGDVAHVEIYAGDGKSRASRNGIGVGEYPFRAEGIKYVLRIANVPAFGAPVINRAKVDVFFAANNGDAYDWFALMNFFDIVIPVNHKAYICSTFVADYLIAAGAPAFADKFPSALINPMDFRKTPALFQVWP